MKMAMEHDRLTGIARHGSDAARIRAFGSVRKAYDWLARQDAWLARPIQQELPL